VQTVLPARLKKMSDAGERASSLESKRRECGDRAWFRGSRKRRRNDQQRRGGVVGRRSELKSVGAERTSPRATGAGPTSDSKKSLSSVSPRTTLIRALHRLNCDRIGRRAGAREWQTTDELGRYAVRA